LFTWKTRQRRDDDIEIYLQEIRREGVDWIDLAQNRASGGLM
jgi:hypothetical protein